MRINDIDVARAIAANDVWAVYQTADGRVWLDLDPQADPRLVGEIRTADMDDARVSCMGTLSLDASDDDLIRACVVDLVLEVKHLRQVARQIVDLQEIQDKRALEQFHLSSDAFLNMLEGVAAKAAWVIGKYGNISDTKNK